MKTYVVLNDVQVPFQDERVLNLVLRFIEQTKPHGVILNGDIADSYPLSSYDKNPHHTKSILDEAEECQEIQQRIDEAGVKEKWWVEGNHEDRLRRYLWKHAPALKLDPRTAFQDLFKLARFGFGHKVYGEAVELGNLTVTHGFLVRMHSAYSAKGHFDRLGASVLVGHTHRLGSYFKTNTRGMHVAYENGCLCKLDAEYVQYPDWQHGFSVVHVGEDGWFAVQQIPILNRKVFYYGKEKWAA